MATIIGWRTIERWASQSDTRLYIAIAGLWTVAGAVIAAGVVVFLCSVGAL